MDLNASTPTWTQRFTEGAPLADEASLIGGTFGSNKMLWWVHPDNPDEIYEYRLSDSTYREVTEIEKATVSGTVYIKAIALDDTSFVAVQVDEILGALTLT